MEAEKTATQGAGIDHVALRRYADLAIEKRDLDARRRGIVADMDELRPALLEQFASHGIQSLRIAEVGTTYLHETGWVRVKREGEKATMEETDRALEALRVAGLGDLIAEKWNVQTLSAIWREWLRDGVEPDQHLRDALDYETTIDIRVRR